MEQFRRDLNKLGKVDGLSDAGSLSDCPLSRYKDSRDWSITYNNFPNLAQLDDQWRIVSETPIKKDQVKRHAVFPPPVPDSSGLAPPTDVGTPALQWKDKSRWRLLEKGMTKAQVQEILGPPVEIDNSYSALGEFWYYPDMLNGEINFDAQGLVKGWREPQQKGN
jgi:hypothetical protein